MKILVDMNLPPRWTAEFGSRGIEASHWSAVGSLTASDREILAWCAEHEYVLFTHDLDFGAILAASSERRPSVVQLRSNDVTPETNADHVLDALRQAESSLAQGALVTIEPGRHRIRFLPLTPE